MRVGFVGTHNSGKSTLVRELNNRNLYARHTYFNDVTRSFNRTVIQNLSTQMGIFDNLVRVEATAKNFISDRTVLDNYAYFGWFYKKAPVKQAYTELFKEYEIKFDKYLATKPYDAVIFVDEYFPIEDNGIRDTDSKQQEWVFEALENIVPLKCEIYNIPYYFVHGSTETRISYVENVLSKYYFQTRLNDFFE